MIYTFTHAKNKTIIKFRNSTFISIINGEFCISPDVLPPDCEESRRKINNYLSAAISARNEETENKKLDDFIQIWK